MRRFLQILFLLLLLTAGIGGRYLYNRGLTKSWREWVVQEVRKHGVEVSFTRLTVRPFRGLVAKDVKFYDSPARNRVIAHMNEMVIEANYANMAKKKPFLDALTLVDTTVRVPLDAKNPFGPAVRVDRLNARILFPPDQVQVTRLDAIVSGIHVRASGSLLVPPGFSLAKDKEGTGTGLAETLVDELGKLQFESRAPALTVHFSGDLGHPEQIVVEADLSAGKIRRGRYALTSLALSAIWQNNVLLLQRLEAVDAKGRLQASGSFDPRTRIAEIRLRSSLDLPTLLRSANVGTLNDFTLPFPPRLDLTAHVEFGTGHRSPPKLQVLGHAGVGNFSYGGVRFESLSADVSWDGQRWAVRDFALRQENGDEITGNAQQDYDAAGTGDFRLGLDSNFSPQTLAPLFDPETRAKLAQVKFLEPPRITLSARGSAPGLDTLSAAGDVKLGRTTYQGGDASSAEVTFRYNGKVTSGTLKLGRTTIRGVDASNLETTFRYDGSEVSGALKLGRTIYRGVEARNAEAHFRYDGRVLTLDTFEVNRTEGSGKGSLAVDFKTGLYSLKDVRTTLHPVEVAQWIDADLVQDIRPYRFGKKPPVLRLDGTLDPRKGGTQTRLTVIADAPGGMDYTFCKKDLHFATMHGNLFFTDERLKLTNVRGELFGGTISADGDVSVQKARPGHTATIALAGVDFAQLSKLYFGFDDSKGKLDGTCTFTGKGDAAVTMRGDGEVSVTDGNVFAIPFLGPLSDILNKIVPGMGISRARKATAKFSMDEGILTNKDLIIEGNGFSMYGGGRIWMVEDKIDYDIRINARGLPGVLLFPMSKLLEYRANSRFTKPDWRLRVVPRLTGEKAP
ncbi:MAG: AsmA-like C-terminal region-containing protein [Chthoniobacteraceae bacterium]